MDRAVSNRQPRLKFGTQLPVILTEAGTWYPAAFLRLLDPRLGGDGKNSVSLADRARHSPALAAARSRAILVESPQVESQMTTSVAAAMNALSHLAHQDVETMRSSA